MIDFNRANTVGLGYVQSWIPGGKQEGNEYKAKNPTRADNKIGSFSINMITGMWADFADFNEAKGDVVALYAYLFRNELPGPENTIMVEAAKAILRKYDGQVIENKTYVKKQGKWKNHHQLYNGLALEELPEFDVSWYAENKAKKPYEKCWDFHSKRGNVVLRIARFRDSEGKQDLPFTLWQYQDLIEWRSINLESKNPLYNLGGLQESQSYPVLLTEGQKNAEDGRELLKDYFITTAVYQSPEKTDLEPLRGRKVFIWADPDNTGRKKASALKKLLEEIDSRVFIMHSPDGKEKWDLSDAIKDGWNLANLVDYIKEFEAPEIADKEPLYLDDFEFPFKVVAVSPGYVYIYNPRNRLVENFKTSSLGKGALLTLMPLNIWADLYPGKHGPSWDNAVDEILARSEKCPLWDPSLVRGAGAWRDTGGKIVCSSGEYLLVDNKKIGLMDFNTKYVYNRTPLKPYTIKIPMDNKESSRFIELFQNVSFEDDLHKTMLAGWAFLAPFCGILKWRPNIWLTGGAGSGKTHVQQSIINNLMEDFSEKVVANGSTEAGIRQKLNNCAVPVTIDEMESNDKNSKETVQLLLSMARQSSSGGANAPEILKGSSDGQGSSFRINSMFFFASILASVEHGADLDRIEILELKSPVPSEMEVRKKQFSNLLELEKDILTPDFKERFYSRALSIIEETLEAIDTFVSLSADILRSQRGGDQKGTLLAGAYMISHDKAPTKEQALKWAEKLQLKESSSNERMKPDEERCLDSILSHHVEVSTMEFRNKQTIGQWVEDFQKLDEIQQSNSFIPKSLMGFGLKVGANYIDIACNYDYIKRILRDTPWVGTYSKLLKRHPDYTRKDVPKTSRFNGVGKSIIRINIDDCPF